MAALSGNDRKTDQFGVPDEVLPNLLNLLMEANTTIQGGALVAIDAAGYAVNASAVPSQKVIGRCERAVANTTAAGFGAQGALGVQVRQGVFYYLSDSSITIANLFSYCYAVDNQTVSISDAGGTRPLCGVIYAIGEAGLYPTGVGQIAVGVGFASPYQVDPETAGASTAFRARAVVTTLSGVYTGSTTGVLTSTANAAFGTQDGVSTLAVGDVVILPAGTTHITAASDAGPYTITALGSGSLQWVLTRPDWWPAAGIIPLGASLALGGEGTLFGGTDWHSFAAKSIVIDASDPVLYPRQTNQQVTLLTGSASAAITNVPIHSASKSNVLVSYVSGAAAVTTVGYSGEVITPGAIGTASVTVHAMAAGMTALSSGDVSVVNVTILNG